MSAEKKMIVGSTLKAKSAPVLATKPAAPSSPPPGCGVPTGTVGWTRLPKMKRAPSSVKPSSAVDDAAHRLEEPAARVPS